jgi:hypothetical protein
MHLKNAIESPFVPGLVKIGHGLIHKYRDKILITTIIAGNFSERNERILIVGLGLGVVVVASCGDGEQEAEKGRPDHESREQKEGGTPKWT